MLNTAAPALPLAERPRGTADLCDALFAAILIDDEVEADARLPAAIRLDFGADELAACFALCRELWHRGFDRAALIAMTDTLLRTGDLPDADRVRFKHVRAKFKHLRYAHALYGAAGHYPPLFDRITITMGHLQDAFRNRRRAAVLREAAVLRLLLTPPATRWLRREADRLVPVTPATFRQRLEMDCETLAALIAGGQVTGHRFHAARKAVGRQVSFWDTLRTLAPTRDRYDMSRFLSAINGLMGEQHDRMVARRATDRASYRAPLVVPEEIRTRVAALVGRLREAIARAA